MSSTCSGTTDRISSDSSSSSSSSSCSSSGKQPKKKPKQWYDVLLKTGWPAHTWVLGGMVVMSGWLLTHAHKVMAHLESSQPVSKPLSSATAVAFLTLADQYYVHCMEANAATGTVTVLKDGTYRVDWRASITGSATATNITINLTRNSTIVQTYNYPLLNGSPVTVSSYKVFESLRCRETLQVTASGPDGSTVTLNSWSFDVIKL